MGNDPAGPAAVLVLTTDVPHPEASHAGSLGLGKLTALGVALAVAGSFGPWGFGIGVAGWAGMLIAFFAVAAFYLCLLWCLADLAARVPKAGGGQAFADHAFGPFGGFLAGAAASVEFLCSTAALSALVATYLQAMTGMNPTATIIALFVLVVAIHLRGVGEAITVTLLLSLVTALGLAVFVATSWLAAPASALAGLGGPVAPYGIWLALPFAVPFFIGIEGTPLAAMDAKNASRDVPRAMLIALAIIAALGLSALVAGPAGAGPDVLRDTADTIMAALGAPPNAVRVAVNCAALAGLCASFFGALYACSRQIHALAAAGDLPARLVRVNAHNAPVDALMGSAASAACLALAVTIDQLIVLLVTAASLFYLMMFAAYVVVRRPWQAERRTFSGTAAVLVGVMLGIIIFSACVASSPIYAGLEIAVLALLALYRSEQQRSRAGWL